MEFDLPKRSISSASQPDFLPKSRTFILVSTIIILTVLLANKFIWKPVIEIDQRATQNIYADHDFKYKNEALTQKLVNDVISSIKPTLKKDEQATELELKAMKELLQQVTDVKQATREDPYYNKGIISTDIQNYIFSLSQSQWESEIYIPVIDSLAKLMAGGLPKDVSKIELIQALQKQLPQGGAEENNKAVIQVISAAFFPDKNIYYGSMKIDSSSEKAKKDAFNKLYLKYSQSGQNNLDVFSRPLEKPSQENVLSVIDRVAHILRELELIKSIKRLNRLAFNVLPSDMRQLTVELSEDDWWKIKEITNNAFEQLLNEGITKVELPDLDENIQKYLPDNLTDNQKKLIYMMITRVAVPNVIIDEKKLEELQKDALKHVKPVYVDVSKGTLLVKKGQIITNDKLKILEAAGELDKKINWNGVSEIFSIVTMMVFIFVIYIYIFEKEVFLSYTNLWLMTLLLLLVTGVSDLVVNNNQQFIPMAIMTGIIAMFISQRAALMSLMFIIILYYKAYDLDFTSLTALTAGSIAAVVLLPKVNQRINILKCGIIIALVQVITYNVSTIILEIPQAGDILGNSGNILFESIIWFMSGVIFSMVILAILPLVEEFFGLVTYSRLTELADFNQPLLRELEEKAPGTFQHSIAVSTLTEYAARKLNLDSTFCRVGSYYHDIGKMLKPEFYIENQFDQENPHDLLNDPYKSAKIIISHARAGVTLAKKNKLPQALMPFMTEHHGTSLVSYFYYKAKQNVKNGEVINESHFRYFGPKPQSKETALAMIADSAEAAVRSLQNKSRANVTNKIKDIVSEKINDGQLSESGLTTDEIAVIIDCYTNVMLEMYHKRIEYPDSKKES